MNPHASQTVIEKNAARLREFQTALVHTFDSPAGTAVLAWLHATAGTRKPTFRPPATAGNPLDPLAAAVRDGRSGLVWEIEANLATARAALASATNGTEKPKTAKRSGVGRKGR